MGVAATANSETYDSFKAAVTKLKCGCLNVAEVSGHLNIEFVQDGLALGAFEVHAGPDVGLLATNKDGKSTIAAASELLEQIKSELETWRSIE